MDLNPNFINIKYFTNVLNFERINYLHISYEIFAY
jgi:hypothetical protein